MNAYPYQDGGPLAPDSPAYIPRKADADALMRLRKMEYLLVTAPHQQGKTSLIGRVASILRDEHFLTILVQLNDLLGLKNQNEWYSTFYQILIDELEDSLGTNVQDMLVLSSEAPLTWRGLLRKICDIAVHENIRLIIALDEAGVIPAEWATDFFSTIRSLYNYRLTQARYSHLSFIVAGTFNPRH